MLINLIGFQIGWFACVLGAAQGHPWVGPVAVLAIVLPQVLARADPSRSATLLVAAATLGYVADSLLVVSDLLAFPPHARLGAPTSLWMVAMWVNVAATLDGALRWLRGRLVLAGLLGAAGGPFAYEAGRRLGAVAFGSDPSAALAGIGLEWALATPVLVLISARAEGASLA